MDNASRMATLAKQQGGPPDEPPMAPPGMAEGEEEANEPQLTETLPAIADYLDNAINMAQNPDQKSKIEQASQLLREAAGSKPPQSEGMGKEDSEAYGESTPEK